jgi:parallel beta-helix repeat protein
MIFNGENISSCISIANSNDYFTIEGCVAYNAGAGERDAGIKLYNVTNGLITNNNCSFNNRNGISLIDSDYNNILKNTVNNNTHGGIVLYSSNNNTLSNNTETINGNDQYGVLLHYSNGTIIQYNIINYNQYAVFLNWSNENLILDNTISYNEYAVYLNRSNNNNMTYNIISNNQCAVLLNSSNDNRVLDNDLEKNVEDIKEDGENDGNVLQSITVITIIIIPIEIIAIPVIIFSVLGVFSVGAILVKKDVISFRSSKRDKASTSTKSRDTSQEREISLGTGEYLGPKAKTSQAESISGKEPAPIVEHKKISKKTPIKAGKKAKSTEEISIEEKEIEQAQKEVEELKKTESEVDVKELDIKCVVHKGTIDGAVYICPQCKTFYCTRCANTLKEKGEKCWSCESDIQVSIQDNTIPEEQRKIRKYGLSLNTLRKTVQNLDDSYFNGGITKDEYSEMREPLMNKIDALMEKIEKLQE